MKILELENKKFVDESQKLNPHPLQTESWGLLKAPQWMPVRLGVYEGDNLQSTVLMLTRKLPLCGKIFGYIPRGITLSDFRSYDEVLQSIVKDVKEKGVSFLLIDPDIDFQALDEYGADYIDVLNEFYQKSGFAPVGRQIQPNRTVVLDLTLSESDLLAGMKSKHRQYVRKAEKSGINVRQGQASDLEIFCRILKVISGDKGYLLHECQYYKNVWDLFSKSGTASLFIAERDKKVLGAYMLLTNKNTVYEMYGGSNVEGSNLRANYLLKWQCIKHFKSEDYHFYDQWGAEPWYPGLVKFKEGFGGKVIAYPGQYVYVNDRLGYKMYKLFERLNRVKQKLV